MVQLDNTILVIALREVLPQQHLQYRLLFVKACTLLCSRTISHSKITESHQYLTIFCRRFQEVNGEASCTPNMHLHLHLAQCLFDFGPLYSFWCYSFERFNGTLGHYPTNQKRIEPQLMKKCLLDQTLKSYNLYGTKSDFCHLLKSSSNTGGCLLSMSPETTTIV